MTKSGADRADPGATDSRQAPDQHRSYAPKSVSAHIVTVSDSRTPDTDTAGNLILELLEAAGHQVAKRVLVKDETPAIRMAALDAIARPAIEALFVTGGTGVAPRDVTVEAVAPLFHKTLPGFGELFRALSYEEIGTAAQLSRAQAGVADATAIFLMPGSRGGVRTAMERVILPELTHLIGQLRR